MHCLLLLLLLLAPPALAADWVPPGFEALNEPQVTVVDINYGGYLVGSALARFTHESLRFLEPEAVAALLPDIRDPGRVLQLLQRDLDTNAGQLCHSGYQLDCGVLFPEELEIIFDRDRLVLSLFVAPDLLQTRGPQDQRYLPDAQSGLSLYSANALYFSGSSETDYAYNLYTNSQLAWKENHLVGRASLTGEALLVDQLSLGRDYRGRQFELGLFRANAESFSFLNTEQFLGLGMQSSLLSLQAAEQYQGTQLELFLPTRSRVELFSEGRLLSARFYDAGNQVIDTSALPAGAYELEIRIIDTAGSTRVEYQYYSKSSRLPPVDAPQYFLQFGRLYQTGVPIADQDDAGLMLRSGFNRRVGEATGLRAGFAATAGQWQLETGFYRMGDGWELQGGVSRDDTGATGLEAGFFWRPSVIALGVNYRAVSGGSEASLLRLSREQLQMSLEVPTRLGGFSLFSRRLGGGIAPDITSNGFRWRSNSWQGSRTIGNASLELSRNAGEALVLLNYTLRFGRSNGADVFSPQLYRDDAGSDVRGTMESTWQPQDRPETLLSLRATRQVRESLEARMAHEGRHLGADVTMRRDLQAGATSVFGRFGNVFAVERDGLVLSGNRAAESAFAVSVDGASPQAEFEVLVDGMPRATVRNGKRTLVQVAPFRSYAVEVRALGDSIINLDQGQQTRVLYPGNVIGLHWTASNVVVGYGKLLDAQGQPLAGALLENAQGLALTEADGSFQAELAAGMRELRVRRQGQVCVAALPDVGADAVLAALGTLHCLDAAE